MTPECKKELRHLGSGAMNVGRRPRRESMIVGQAGCSIASPAVN
jgi:glutamyl-tRNA reductase